LRKRGSELALTVADDGQGFDLKQLETSDQEGIGLISMRERIAAFGGSFKIRSVPGKGTSVRACVPLGEIVSTDLTPATEEVLR
jgi:signal transduction histidine kinase